MLLFPRLLLSPSALVKISPLLAKISFVTFASLSLGACGGGSESGLSNSNEVPSQQSYRLSGTITIAETVQIDSDNNDINSPAKSNNTISDAQGIDALVLLSGFVAEEATGIEDQRFKDEADKVDYFKANLIRGQLVTLSISEWEQKDGLGEAPDLDLVVFDSDGKQLVKSDGRGKTEAISINESATYYIAVEAFSGHSGYLLAIDQSNTGSENPASTTQTKQAEFVLGQAIVQYRDVSSEVSRKSSFQTSGLSSNHNQTDRPALVKFDAEGISTPAISALSSRSGYLAKSTVKPTKAEPSHRQELAQFYPKLYEKLKTYDVIKSLNLRDDVEYAEPNFIRHIKRVPNDRGYESQWHYPLINLPKAWDITTGTPAQGQVVVAVIDTGILPNHPDLKNQLVPGYDFLRDVKQANDGNGIDSDPTDAGDGDVANGKPNSWHGSHVAGTIAAQSNNTTGVAGVSWGAKIMPIRALGVGGGTTYSIVQSLRFASGLSNDSGTRPAQRADIINMSLGGPDFSQTEQNAIRDAHNAGVILVAAAGNESTTAPSYPAAFPHVISVSSIAADARFASSYSNSGSTIDVAAPGGNTSQDLDDDGYADGVLSTVKNDRTGEHSYAFYEGTSMAAPHVSGVFALMKAINPQLTPDDIESALISGQLTTDAGSSGRDDLYGYGIIDAFKAVSYASSTNLQDVVISPSSTALQFASFQSSKVLDLKNLGRIGNTSDIQSSVSVDAAPWLTVNQIAARSGALASYQFAVDREGLSLGVYETTARFSFTNQGVALETKLAITIRMYVGLTTTPANAGPLYILAREQGVELQEGEFHPQAFAQASDGEYQFEFNNLKAGQYIIHAGTDSDSNLFICNEHEACGFYPTITRPVAINLNRNIVDLNFSVGILRPIDLDVSAKQNKGDEPKTDYTAKRQGSTSSTVLPERQPAVLLRSAQQPVNQSEQSQSKQIQPEQTQAGETP